MNIPESIDARNTNVLWASVLVETLVRSGIHYAVVCPGSRSTPLAVALSRHHDIEAIPVIDERSAGFFALGLAKQRLDPVVLVCTSGTAAANFFPAIVEAHEGGVPLVVLTADRPPEMRACASGQTIDQQKLYGSYVSFYHEFTVPAPSEARLRYVRQTTAHAVTRALAPTRGPVHLNIPFRDPLAPVSDGGTAERCAAGIDWGLFFSHLSPTAMPVVGWAQPDHAGQGGAALPLTPEVHGAIIVGPTQPADADDFVTHVGEIARRLGWPVLADGLSPVRNHQTRVPHLVTTYDLILRNENSAARLRPEVVLCIGGWPTSKVLRGWLDASPATTIWLASERADNRDSLHLRTRQLGMSLAALAQAVPSANDENGYERMWAHYEETARAALDERLRGEETMFEPYVAWLLAQYLPERTSLVIANSMPVRDVEYVWPPNDRGIRPYCNRGANGIDGTLSTALGLAHDGPQPSVLLTGDLALLHDTNGFLLRQKVRGGLTIVLINNRGGGIFEHLPISDFDPPFEDFFATPQDVDFAKLCAAHGVEHETVHDWQHLTDLVSMLPDGVIRVLEVRTNRKRDAAQRKAIFAEIAAQLG